MRKKGKKKKEKGKKRKEKGNGLLLTAWVDLPIGALFCFLFPCLCGVPSASHFSAIFLLLTSYF